MQVQVHVKTLENINTVQYTITCPVCKETIDTKEYVEANSSCFHQDCFKCNQCLEDFTKGEFYEVEDKLYCEFDFNIMFGNRCTRCCEIIKGPFVNALDSKWHPEHFTCEICDRQLQGSTFVKRDGKPYCKSCKAPNKEKNGEACSICKAPLTTQKIIFNDQKVHAFHYNCTTCKITLTAADCKEFENRLYCLKDYQKKITQNIMCFGCKKGILGRSVQALGKYFHPDHFVCAKCEKPFTGESFMEHNQKAYCMYHYNEVTGSLCGTCYEPASGKDVVDAMGKKFCEGHFVCAGCQTNLMGAGNKFGEWDSKPLCTRCWNALPLDIRKRLNEYLKIEKKVSKEMAK